VSRPLIAVPAYPVLESERIHRFSDDAVVVPVTYIHALRRAGGLEAILLPTSLDDTAADAILDRYDGVMLLGGGDLEPAIYGQDAHHTVYNIDTDRDDCELAITRAAIAREMPVLAICRGHQVLNVALGGTLDQHISDRDGLAGHGIPGADGTGQMHDIEIEEGSRLATAMGTTHATCSSHHHQAVERTGDGLRVVARAPDGIIEGIELVEEQAPWVVGAQWHPEDTAPTDPAQQGIFDAFVEQAAKRRTQH
jgi:putative glutamine amidotransferase